MGVVLGTLDCGARILLIVAAAIKSLGSFSSIVFHNTVQGLSPELLRTISSMYLLWFVFSGGAMMDDILHRNYYAVKWLLCVFHVVEVRWSKGFTDILYHTNARTSNSLVYILIEIIQRTLAMI